MDDEYKKCEICGKRFRVQEWKEGIERRLCFTCKLGVDKVLMFRTLIPDFEMLMKFIKKEKL